MQGKINHKDLLRDVELVEMELGKKHGCKIEIRLKVYNRSIDIIIEACNVVYRRFNPNGYLDIRVRTKQKDVVMFRQLACFLLNKAGYSLAIIGQHLKIDHSTVYYSTSKIEKKIRKENAVVKQYIELVEFELDSKLLSSK
jgi:chromosomal replication initiation ATPase DnaA